MTVATDVGCSLYRYYLYVLHVQRLSLRSRPRSLTGNPRILQSPADNNDRSPKHTFALFNCLILTDFLKYEFYIYCRVHLVFPLLFDNNFAHPKTESAASQDSGMVHNMSIRSSLTPNIFIFVIPLCHASTPPPLLRNRT